MQHYLSQKEEDTQAHTRQTMASFRDNINESSKLQITLEVPEYCILILDQRRESLGKFCHKNDVFTVAELKLSLLCLFCALRSQVPTQHLIFLQVCCSVDIIPLSLVLHLCSSLTEVASISQILSICKRDRNLSNRRDLRVQIFRKLLSLQLCQRLGNPQFSISQLLLRGLWSRGNVPSHCYSFGFNWNRALCGLRCRKYLCWMWYLTSQRSTKIKCLPGRPSLTFTLEVPIHPLSWHFPFSQPLDTALTVPEQMTPVSL